MAFRKCGLLGIVALLSLGFGSAAIGDVSFDGKQAGNPVLPGYFADPNIKKFGDTFFIYSTPDGWDAGKGPAQVWTSKDFVNWKCTPMNWPTTDFKWAPCVVEKGGKYYMYSQVPCQIWAGVADSPFGPWKNMMSENKPFIPDQTPKGTITLDAEVFTDNDGSSYLYYGTWGTFTAVKLGKDMCSFDGEPLQYFGEGAKKNGSAPDWFEAPYTIKRNGTYYHMYSVASCHDGSYRVAYVTSKSPLGPWTYDEKHNPILETTDDDTINGPGHHSIFQDGDDYYICYHRHDNPHSPDGMYRQVAVDRMYFNADGSIQKVVPTHRGVGYLAKPENTDVNLALGKPVKASSSFSAEFKPEFAADENNGSLWKASDKTFPQWLQVDLGKEQVVKRVVTEFQYPEGAYKYQIEYSADGAAWKTFADRRENKDWAPMIDIGNVKARYVRITILANGSGKEDHWAALWGFKVYGDLRKTKNEAPVVDAGEKQKLSIGFNAVFAADATDDGFPNGKLSATWTKKSGPDGVVLTNPKAFVSEAQFSKEGTYTFEVSVSDGKLSASDTVEVVVTPSRKSAARTGAANGPVVWYKFDEASGNKALDSSGNGIDASMIKNATRAKGKFGQALSLDGASWATVPALGALPAFTFSTWINIAAVQPGYIAIEHTNGYTPGDVHWLLDSGQVRVFFSGNNGRVAGNYKFTQEDIGKWKHVAVTYDCAAKTIKLYIDGKLDGETTYLTCVPAMVDGMRIGAWNYGPRAFNGMLDDFRVYDRAMSADEIKALFDAAK